MPKVDPEPYRDAIRGYLLRLSQDPATADDLTQEVFIKVHRHAASLRDQSGLKSWIYRIASNLFIDHTRTPTARMERASDRLEDSPAWSWEDEPLAMPDEALIRQEQSDCIQEYVHALPPSYRAVLVLHDVEGLTHLEIAEVLGCSVATAKIRLHRARGKLRAAMDRGCDIGPGRRGAPVCHPKKPN